MDLYLTRAQLRSDVDVAALATVLMKHTHELVWSLMSDSPDRDRDFLFRQHEGGLLVLSDRAPAGSAVMDHQTKVLPTFENGDRLRFALRANPVIRRKRDDGRTVKIDPIMDRLHPLPQSERRAQRMEIAAEVSEDWLRRLGEGSGYHLEACALMSYRQDSVPRKGASRARFSVVELEGVLTVTDAAAFRDRLKQGFGASRAWGCGMMLVRR